MDQLDTGSKMKKNYMKDSMIQPNKSSGDTMNHPMPGSQEREEDSREENINHEKEERKVAKADPEETSKVFQKERAGKTNLAGTVKGLGLRGREA